VKEVHIGVKWYELNGLYVRPIWFLWLITQRRACHLSLTNSLPSLMESHRCRNLVVVRVVIRARN